MGKNKKHQPNQTKPNTKRCSSLWLVCELVFGPRGGVSEWTPVWFPLPSIWSCCRLCSATSGPFGLIVTVSFYVAILDRMKATCRSRRPRKNTLDNAGLCWKNRPRPPPEKRASVFIGLSTVCTEDVGRRQEGIKAALPDAETEGESRAVLTHQG